MNPQDTDIHEEALKLLWSSFLDPKNIDFLHINIGFLYSNYKDKVILLTWNCTNFFLPESKGMLIFIYIHLWYDVEQWRMSTVGEIERDDSIKEGLVGGKLATCVIK